MAHPSRVSCNRPLRLISRCSSVASPPGMQRPAEPAGMNLMTLGLELDPLRLSCHPGPCTLQESSASQLSHNLDNLTLQPQLVARGTSLPLLPKCSEASWPRSASSLHPTMPPEQLNDISREPPKLVITEQPKQRGMRFRYQCEGRSAGSILGEGSTDTNKTLPTIELQNCGGIPEVKVTACLVWKDWPHRIHPHSLVGKDCSNGLCEVILKPRVNPKHSFNNLGIQCVKKKDIEDSIEKKLQLGIDPFKAGSLKNHQEVDMNVVRICFQASYQNRTGETQHLSPILSEPIYDKKSTNTSELKIYRMNKEYGSCAGGEELYLLCDKVQKEDISIIFRKDTWEGKADFSQADVHRQIAIVFKTPPYQHLDIPQPVEVEVYLRRLTDSVSSDPFNFTYLPKDNDTYRVNKKRKQGMPDVLEELSGPDPHGIEAKRKRKKPGYMDQFNLMPSAAGSLTHPEEMTFLAHLERITVPEPFEDYSLLQDLSSYSGPSLSDVLLPSCMDFPDAAEHGFLLDNYSLRSGASASFSLSADCDPEGTASLVGSSMFPSQFKEVEVRVEMEAKLQAAEASKTL
ncbi:transcription factor RelB isoform X1 [Hemicordylus capensis]|nr:transcription factor RelB isoform X1 [Hemicordylus capensis]XP_053123891.1 transcription factor RelB isoform X1 [Hemicordylus capensis]XP_053123892.1 transcription factor RelB isoform X1 [Hemicordylus capensis]XP_053123893.1 transcription factor RelB isoform X1 [Hemicordylus capensis]XP_053123894.1 transcription factor RelB isoform X1 [Hemicordylus capensis]XP_053123895.1 transcription factor RelB isoform X1 [Hemicordylus capensis]XP_053123896.1 transcription factor RelB isoform X1 [Hemico